MSIQDWALSWFSQERNTHCVEDVVIIHAGGSCPLSATIIEPDTLVTMKGLKVKTDKTLFIVNTKDLKGISIRPGVRIVRNEVVFQVAIDGTKIEYFNDPNENETVIPTVRQCN